MSRRKRAARTVQDLDVQSPVLVIAAALWLLLGTVLWLHLDTFDLPPNYPRLLGWAAGGFPSASFYVLFACD